MLDNMGVSEKETFHDFTPAINTREGEYAYHVEVDLPAVKKEKDGIIESSRQKIEIKNFEKLLEKIY